MVICSQSDYKYISPNYSPFNELDETDVTNMLQK